MKTAKGLKPEKLLENTFKIHFPKKYEMIYFRFLIFENTHQFHLRYTHKSSQ